MVAIVMNDPPGTHTMPFALPAKLSDPPKVGRPAFLIYNQNDGARDTAKMY